MRLFDFIWTHLLDDFLKADRRVGITADGGQRVPHIRADKVGRGHAPAYFVVPTDARLRTGVPLHRRTQIPLECAHIVARNTEAEGIHDADQFFGVRVAGSRRWPQRLARLFKLSGLHQIARFFDVCPNGCCEKQKKHHCFAHGLAFAAVIATPVLAEEPHPLTANDFIAFDEKQAALGQLLFYDKILSGNRNIACSTCHHPALGTSDGLSLGIGEGGVGLGHERTAGTGGDRIKKRIPRNSPGLWNLGAKEIDVLFHDGRLSISDAYENGFDSPAEEWLPKGFNSILAAQAVFPLVAQFEMAGNPKENEIAGAVHDRIDAAWPILAKRVRVTGDYGARFVEAFDHLDRPEDVSVVEIANALAAFMGTEWQSFDSPYDRYLAGDAAALSLDAQAGKDLFFGKAQCASCHSGALFSDQEFHALRLPPFGPGRTRRFDPAARDVGRMGETDRLEDAYRFRTPMLRNVELTPPYGHNGGYPSLEEMVRHHVTPSASFAAWTREKAALPPVAELAAIDFVVWSDKGEMARQAAANDLPRIDLNDDEISSLVAFMKSLTGGRSIEGRLGIPNTVPSGLAVDRSNLRLGSQ